MFRKSGFVLRSLFVTFLVGSLVACTFEGATEEERGNTTANISKPGDKKVDKNAIADEDDGADAEVPAFDAGPAGHDASAFHDGGSFDASHDGGDHVNDGGAWSQDGGNGGSDAGGDF